MKKINIILAIICIALVSSCKSFLDVKPTNSTSSDASIKTVQDAKVAINGLMRQLTNYNYYGRNFLMYGDSKGGDFTIYTQGRGLDGLYAFNHSASSGSYSGFWDHFYFCILQINTIIENIEKIEKDSQEDFSLQKGQALTARALVYFDLVRLYGQPYNMNKDAYGVPNITKTLPTSAQPIRSKVSENYVQILKDLSDANLLLEKDKRVDELKGYINYYTNIALQAKVNLYMENYDNALTAAEIVINSKKYSLYSNEEWVKSWASEFGKESIFELTIVENEGDLGTGSLGWYHMCYGKQSKAQGFFLASDYFLQRLGEDKKDIRWGIMGNDEYWVNTEEERLGACYKYSGSESEQKGDKGSPSAVNIKVIRLSEVYLIAAEAALNAKTPDKKKAADYLNEIRKRSPNLAPATATTITNDMILDERSKELYGEGQRFFDMMRMNKKIEFNDDFQEMEMNHREKIIDRTFYKCILPISQDEMNVNPPIAAQQNPGY